MADKLDELGVIIKAVESREAGGAVLEIKEIYGVTTDYLLAPSEVDELIEQLQKWRDFR